MDMDKMILEQVKEEYVKELLKAGKRTDGRALDQYREISVTKGYLRNAEGSALACIGATKVLAGVKFDMLEPFADRPAEGVVMVNCEFSPAAHPGFNPGPPDENSIELARVVDRGIRSAEAVDVAALGATGSPDGKVLGVFIDLYVLDHSGNLTDCAALAAMAALKDAKVPQLKAGKIVRGSDAGRLSLRRNVVTCTFENVAGSYLLDANFEEEVASDGRLTIGVSDDGFVCAGQKSGAASITKDALLGLARATMKKSGELFAHI
ncbi:exosome complex protein Rrp42 [Candidatus Micrarchaeota archaeon]|nr:exosome complex protein Rrp42 [Candidatus Micrarchaeota archaeon]